MLNSLLRATGALFAVSTLLSPLQTEALAAEYQELYEAKHCEVFIDQLNAYRSSHALTVIEVYVKTLNDRLDGAIDKVIFEARQKDDIDSAEWQEVKEYTLSAFPSADDYHVLKLVLAHDYMNRQVFEGSFLVLTDQGTAYRFGPNDSDPFYFDINAWQHIANEIYPNRSYGTGVERAVGTIDRFAGYYNPQGCY